MPRKAPPTEAEIQRIKDLFGRSLEAMRKQQGFTNRLALAARAGVSDESLGRIERGEGNPELATLIRIAVAMGCSLAQLFGSMGQSEGGGRQLTVHERGIVLTGIGLIFEAFTGNAVGELTGHGVARPTPSPAPARPQTTPYARPRKRRRTRAKS